MHLTVFFSQVILALYLLPANRARGCANSSGFCERVSFDLFKDTLKNRALKGHTFLTTAVQDAPECQTKCMSDCRCLSTNYRQTNKNGYGQCELNNADHVLLTKQLVATPGSYYYKLERKFDCQKDKVVFNPRHHPCPKSCCRSSTCPAHTTCREMCLPKFKRFLCVCPPGLNTNGCEHLPRSCFDVATILGFSPSDGLYHVFDSQDSLYQVYCDFSSEPRFAFTLIESFSFAHRNIFKTLGFYTDSPIGQDSFNWVKYRLSKKRMQIIANHSTHLRSTCNRPIGFSFTDYLRVNLQQLNLFQIFSAKCPRYDRMNFAGHECLNCTVGTWQVANEHFHISNYYSISLAGCEFGYTGFSQALFGFYPDSANPGSFSCCNSGESTTQFWIGSRFVN